VVAILVYLLLSAAAVGLLLLALFVDDAVLGTLALLALIGCAGAWWLVGARHRHLSS
jgi:hypothetical protein